MKDHHKKEILVIIKELLGHGYFGLYYDSLKNSLKVAKTQKEKQNIEEKLEKFRDKTTKTFEKEIMENGCLGGIAELYDSKKPQLPKGAINQAWSVAEVFRIMLGK